MRYAASHGAPDQQGVVRPGRVRGGLEHAGDHGGAARCGDRGELGGERAVQRLGVLAHVGARRPRSRGRTPRAARPGRGSAGPGTSSRSRARFAAGSRPEATWTAATRSCRRRSQPQPASPAAQAAVGESAVSDPGSVQRGGPRRRRRGPARRRRQGLGRARRAHPADLGAGRGDRRRRGGGRRRPGADPAAGDVHPRGPAVRRAGGRPAHRTGRAARAAADCWPCWPATCRS